MKRMLLSLLTLSLCLRADEGMWTFDNIPTRQIQKKYGFTPTQAWLDHLRLSSLHWGGASGSFVSADGLVATNHHVGRGSIGRISTKEKDYLTHGFIAKTREEEIKIPGLSLRTLMHLENITQEVQAAVTPGMTEKQAQKAREAVMEARVAAATKATQLQCQPVSFYEGGEVWIYGYKVHTDVRLVAAPELQLGLFGGDPDNFTYPRHDLDFCLFRVYENNQPYHPQHFLRWSTEGVKHNELTFVSGHPGRTARAWTHAQMCFERDSNAPFTMKAMERQLEVLRRYADQSEENRRTVTTRILGIENGLKASKGYFNGLMDREGMAKVAQQEKELRSKVAKNPALQASAGQSWARIQAALKARERWNREALVLDGLSQTLNQALGMLRYAQEAEKPEGKRLPDYATEEKLKAVRRRLEGGGGPMAGPSNKELDTALLVANLKLMQEWLPAQHPVRTVILGKDTPEAVAKSLVEGSQLQEAQARKTLLEGGSKALQSSTDSMMQLARKLWPHVESLRKQREDYTATLSEHASRIARARFAVYGRDTYPDANGTLRLGFGTVAPYPAHGTLVQPFTTYGGLFDRHDGWGGNTLKAEQGAWALPQRWLDARTRLNLATPLNFVHTVDTIGGNSGSPIVNTKGELVGLLFDGNYESLPSRYFYEDRVNRSVSVDARGILEALEKVYEAPHLVRELTGK